MYQRWPLGAYTVLLAGLLLEQPVSFKCTLVDWGAATYNMMVIAVDRAAVLSRACQ